MKRLFLSIFVIAFSLNCFSQHLLNLDSGPSIPAGEYSNNDYLSEKAGYAKTGMNINFSYGYVWKSGIGINCDFNASNNPVDVYELEKVMEMFFQAPVSMTMDDYLLASVLISPYFSFGNKVKVDFAPSFGVLFAKIGWMESYINYEYTMSKSPVEAENVCVGLTSKLRIPLSKILDLSVSGRYRYAEPVFRNNSYKAYRQPVSLIQLNAGVVLKIK